MHIYMYQNEQLADPRSQHQLGWCLLDFAVRHENIKILPDWQEHILYEKNGKPFCKMYPDLFFNLSHTKEMVTVVTGQHPTGVDVEKIRPVTDRILRRFKAEEIRYINQSNDRWEAFYRIWTMKEAYGKMKGIGIAILDEPICFVPGHSVPGCHYRQMIWNKTHVITAFEEDI